MTIIHVHDLWKTYPTKPPITALRDFSLEIREGETFGVLGPNGAGKTTFIRILLGLLLPDKGEVIVKGLNPINKPREVAKHLRFVPEQPFLEKSWTLWQNARYWFTVWEEQWNPAKLISTFERFNLQEQVHIPLNRYSRGMQQKAGLALALSTSIPIIILDEPTLGLDILAIEEMLNIMSSAKADGKTIIFASHNMSFVEKIADRIGLIANGTMLEIDDTQKFRRKFGHERIVLRYRATNENKDTKEIIVLKESFSIESLLKKVSDQGAELLELRREVQPLEDVIRHYLNDRK